MSEKKDIQITFEFFWFVLFLFMLFFSGEPDLKDAIIFHLMNGG